MWLVALFALLALCLCIPGAMLGNAYYLRHVAPCDDCLTAHAPRDGHAAWH